ncbi:hypothetical protein CORC01_06676 [Colletotrichum orchidophilum]|uniref:Uncharacterized protein n=1 Tax=Colletotrichum orchidophilum TaxID=1209926 RepID=A0A1G4B9B3_9PEZI|nr:uncharacterized protein CORC01_06676 [Colletotrichum orchidophilum]OHE98007.1 hypothetical protein CORC01_06676 [Colletotrichum orchidophilum]
MRGNLLKSGASDKLFQGRRRPLTRAESPPILPRTLFKRTAVIPSIYNLNPPNPPTNRNIDCRSAGHPISTGPSQANGGRSSAQASLVQETRLESTTSTNLRNTDPSTADNFDKFSFEIRPQGVTSGGTLLKTAYDSFCPGTLLASSTAQKLNLRRIPGQPGKPYAAWTPAGYIEIEEFVRVHAEVPGLDIKLGDYNFGIVPDNVLQHWGSEILVGSKPFERLVTDDGLSTEIHNALQHIVNRQRPLIAVESALSVTNYEQGSQLGDAAPGSGIEDFGGNSSFHPTSSEDNASEFSTRLTYPSSGPPLLGHLNLLDSSTSNAFETMATTTQGQTPFGYRETSNMAAWTPNEFYTWPTSDVPSRLHELQLPHFMGQVPLEETANSNVYQDPHCGSEG